MMYKFLLIKFFLTVILILSSCSYNEIEVRKKNIQAYKPNKLTLYTNKKLDSEFRKEKAKINKKYIIATIDGKVSSVPLDTDNRHYAEILKQVAEGKLTIKDAE